jgi:phosphoribosyl-AMP cyclohydrolase
MSIADEIDFDDSGLVPAVVQDAENGDVLMVAYMNREALEKTLETGFAHYWSRSRDELWKKGATSGNLQKVKSVKVDCDADTILLQVTQEGVACHEGYRSCFFRSVDGDSLRVNAERIRDPKKMYGK